LILKGFKWFLALHPTYRL